MIIYTLLFLQCGKVSGERHAPPQIYSASSTSLEEGERQRGVAGVLSGLYF